MKKTFLLLPFAGFALASAAQVPATAAGTPQGKIALKPAVKPVSGVSNANTVKMNSGTMRKLVTPPVLLYPPGLVQGEQLLTAANPSEGPRQTTITISGSKLDGTGNVSTVVGW